MPRLNKDVGVPGLGPHTRRFTRHAVGPSSTVFSITIIPKSAQLCLCPKAPKDSLP